MWTGQLFNILKDKGLIGVVVMEKNKEMDIPIEISDSQYRLLKENLELFNRDIEGNGKLTFDEFISLVFEASSLEERLDSKYDYLNALKSEIARLEDELAGKYSAGLTGSKEENKKVIELRKKIVKDSSAHINGLY